MKKIYLTPSMRSISAVSTRLLAGSDGPNEIRRRAVFDDDSSELSFGSETIENCDAKKRNNLKNF